MRMHNRETLTVRGELNPSSNYFDKVIQLTKSYCIEKSEYKVLIYDLRNLIGTEKSIIQVVSNNKEFISSLAEKVKKIDLTKKIEVSGHVVDLDNPHSHN